MAKSYDLDVLAPEETFVTIFKKRYQLEEPTLETLPALQRLTADHALDQIEVGSQLTDEQLVGLKESAMLVIPNLEMVVIQKMTTTQWVALQRIMSDVVRPSEEKLDAFFKRDEKSESEESEDGELDEGEEPETL